MANKISFVLGATAHGPMIFSRLDYRQIENRVYGVGAQLMENGAYDPEEVKLLKQILKERRRLYGKGVLGIDCGANIGVHALEWGRLMRGWGKVLALEAQERIYYALAGNVALHNLFNVKAIHAAVSNMQGDWMISCPDYSLPSSYGSFELKKREHNEFIGQVVDYNKKNQLVPLVTLDQFRLNRCDLIKIDVEGMEMEVIEGACNTIKTCSPVLCIELIKSDRKKIINKLNESGYKCFVFGLNLLAVHEKDKLLPLIHGNLLKQIDE